MINQVNANVGQLYASLSTQAAQTQSAEKPLEEYALKDPERINNAIVLSSQVGNPVKITGEALYTLLEAQETGASSPPPSSHNAMWQTIAGRYDVTNISTNERIAMTQELLNNQLIPNDVGLTMMAPLSMEENLEQKVDYLSIAQDSFEIASKNGLEKRHLEVRKQSLEILERIHSLSS